MKYRRDIDGLRAMAVIPVMLFHAGVPIFPGGFVGVDVFFVISGYLISTLIIQDLRQGSFSLAAFYERRVRRIMPALVIIMLFSVPAAWVLMPPADLKDFTESLAAVTVSLSNVLFWSESGYFATDAELKPLLHTCSLGVEEQFYLLYPIILVWVHRHRHHGPWLLGMLGLASLAFAQWQVVHQPQAAFFLLPARFWELLAGGLAAFVLLDRPAIISHALRPVGSAIGLLMIVAAALLFDSDLPFPGMSALLPVAGSVLVILCAGPDNFVGRLLGSHPLVGIGLVSYSAYLWHQPLLAFARYREHSLDAGILGPLLCLLSLILAWFTWRFIERPFRTPGEVSTKNLTRLALVSGVGFIIFGVVGHMTDGFPRQRVSETKQQLLASAIAGLAPQLLVVREASSKFYDPKKLVARVASTNLNTSGVPMMLTVADSYGLPTQAPPRQIEVSGQAERIDFEGENHYTLADSSYSTCKPEQTDWYLKTSEKIGRASCRERV